MKINKSKVPFLPRFSDGQIVASSEQCGLEDFKKILRSLQMKVTQQRLLIIEKLYKGKRHVSVQELFEEVRSTHPEIGFATIYRFLKDLAQGNIISEIRMGGLPARYEWISKKHHDHLSCTCCGKIIEFENNAIEELQEKVALQFGFHLTSHSLELYGICPDCRVSLENVESFAYGSEFVQSSVLDAKKSLVIDSIGLKQNKMRQVHDTKEGDGDDI